METMTYLLTILAGLLIRLAVPIVGTGILIYCLRKLDDHWQTEAQLSPISTQKPECWKIKGCPPEQRKKCVAVASSLPCWQVYRLPNGYLCEKCVSCKVFIEAPIPALA